MDKVDIFVGPLISHQQSRRNDVFLRRLGCYVTQVFVEFVAVDVQRFTFDQTLLTARLSYYSLITVDCMCKRAGSFQQHQVKTPLQCRRG